MARCVWIAGALIAAMTLNTASAGWPFFGSDDDGPHRGTTAYSELHANDPPGARQLYVHGKMWPPFPRPVGPHSTFLHKFHHTHYWPYPYSCQDRSAVAAFVNVQVANGWAAQTTLYDYHFDPLTNELNSSGRSHLHWILVHVPPEHRTVSVALTEQAEGTAVRTANVERELARMAGGDPSLQVTARLADPAGRPASEVQSIFTSAQQNMPPPILSPSAGEQSDE